MINRLPIQFWVSWQKNHFLDRGWFFPWNGQISRFRIAQKVGKQVGGDIIANKKTLLLIHALDKAEGAQAAELKKLISTANFNPTEKVDSVKAIYRDLKIEEFANAQIDYFYKEALKNLEEVSVSKEQKKPLHEFATWLMNRDK